MHRKYMFWLVDQTFCASLTNDLVLTMSAFYSLTFEIF